jgi:hypothetical protein
MASSAFRQGIFAVLKKQGFQKTGPSMRREQERVTVLVGADKGLGKQWYLYVGFWLEALGQLDTDRVWRTHLYLRLERLLPSYRDIILAAGDMDASDQQRGYNALLELLAGDADARLRSLGSEQGLRNALLAGELTQSLSTPEVRRYLGGS